MTIKPLDIQQQNFTVAFRGYDRDEVTEFLDLVGQSLESLIVANLELTHRVDTLEEKLTTAETREEEVRELLATTRESAVSSAEHATDKANLIVREAKLEAERIVAQANAKVASELEEIAELGRNKHRLKASLRSILDLYGRMLDEEAEGGDRFNVRSPDAKVPAETSPETLASNSHIPSVGSGAERV